MTNIVLLRDAVNESGLSKTYIARKMGCSRPRLYRILDGSDCTVSEMVKLSEILRLTNRQRTDIFLPKKVN